MEIIKTVCAWCQETKESNISHTICKKCAEKFLKEIDVTGNYSTTGSQTNRQ